MRACCNDSESTRPSPQPIIISNAMPARTLQAIRMFDTSQHPLRYRPASLRSVRPEFPAAGRGRLAPAAAVLHEPREPTPRIIRMARLTGTSHFLIPQSFEARITLPARFGQPLGEFVERMIGGDEALRQSAGDLLSLRLRDLPGQDEAFVDTPGFAGDGFVVARHDGRVDKAHGLGDGLHLTDQQRPRFARQRSGHRLGRWLPGGRDNGHRADGNGQTDNTRHQLHSDLHVIAMMCFSQCPSVTLRSWTCLRTAARRHTVWQPAVCLPFIHSRTMSRWMP